MFRYKMDDKQLQGYLARSIVKEKGKKNIGTSSPYLYLATSHTQSIPQHSCIHCTGSFLDRYPLS